MIRQQIHRIRSLVIIFLLLCPSRGFGEGAAEVANKFCPVLINELVDPDIFVEYKGRKVNLCCQKCKKLFLEDPESYFQNLPAVNAPSQEQPLSSPPIVSPAKPVVAPLVKFLGHFHPVAVHFPIALIIAAGLAEILRIVRKEESWAKTSQFCVILGALGAVASAGLGWLAAVSQDYQGEYLTILNRHRWGGIAVAIGSLLTALWSFSGFGNNEAARRKIYRALLAVSAALVMATGFFGGQLVYGINHF